MQKITPLARKNNLVIQELDNEILIYDLKTNKVFGLNETAALVWQFADGKRNTAEIAQRISEKLGSPIDEEFVWLALGRLEKEKLIENEIPEFFEGANRREVIKRIGLTSMVVLPMISSLIAPVALQAQSGSACGTSPFPLGCTCTNSSLCTSGCCNFPIGGSGVCVQMSITANGSPCAMACYCASGCCDGVGFVCISPNSKPAGSPCVFSCECVSGTICTGFFPNTMCA